MRIELLGIDKVVAAVKKDAVNVARIKGQELKAFGESVTLAAKQKLSSNRTTDVGRLANSISYQITDGRLEIIAQTLYAAYIEFGTGKYAAQYVATLPPDWASFAAKFKGKTGRGTFADLVENLVKWVHRKGIAGSINETTGRRSKSKTQEAEDYSAAYIIALAIIKNGIKAQPFLYPSYKENLPIFMANLKKSLDAR